MVKNGKSCSTYISQFCVDNMLLGSLNMKSFLRRYFCGQRNVHWILTCSILILLSLVTVFSYVRCGENATETEAIEPGEPKIRISFVNRNADYYYLAAVIEYEMLYLPDVQLASMINLQNIIEAVAECGKLNVDIVVFPEDSLLFPVPISRTSMILISSYVPLANDLVVPCHHKEYEQSHLRQLSCAAKENRIYVAVNVMEKVNSENSTFWDGLLFYKTEVVFDRNGMVVARYRKFNLYQEQWFQHTSVQDAPEYVTFTTDFGVEFGIITCFDIFFTEPGVVLAQQRNITHFIHSSTMQSRLPFLVGSTVEFGWSHALDVVVLASSSPYPKHNLGTNIYFGLRQGTRTYIHPIRSSNIIISPVPKHRHLITPNYPDQFHWLDSYIPGQPRPSSFLVEHVLDRMTTRALPSTPSTQPNHATFTYQSATFECNITASWEIPGFISSNHQFIAYSGLNNLSVASVNFYAEMCGITLCARSNLTSCQQPPVFDDASRVIFTSLTISTRSKDLDSVRIPAAFDSNLVALDGTRFFFRSRPEEYFGKTTNRVEMKLKRSLGNLTTFAVYKYSTECTPIANFSFPDLKLNEDEIS